MNYLQLQVYCLSLPSVTEDMPFGDNVLAYRIGGSIFALFALNTERRAINLKCDPDIALRLRDRYEDIVPGYHMDKKHWNTVYTDNLPKAIIEAMIRHSYQLIVTKLSKAKRKLHSIELNPSEDWDSIFERL